MKTISSDNSLDLYKKAFMTVHDLPLLRGDMRNYKDTFAVLTLKNFRAEPHIKLTDRGFESTFDYDRYIEGGNKWMKVEIDYYNKELVQNGKVQNLIKYFNTDCCTRRGVICFWENPELESAKPFPCTVYVFFRKIGNRLNMNNHMRANDAYKILLMDVHIAMALHVYVAQKLHLKVGTFNHIVDSLHLYKEAKTQIDRLYKQFSNHKYEKN